MSRSKPGQLSLNFGPLYPKARSRYPEIPKREWISQSARAQLFRSLKPKTLHLSVNYLPRTVIDLINERLKSLSAENDSGVKLIGKIKKGTLGNFEISIKHAEKICQVLSSSETLGFSAMVSGDRISIYSDPSKQDDPYESLGGGVKRR